MKISVRRDLTKPLRHVVSLGPQDIAVDGTVEEGGEGAGASPHDLYDASLAACTALTIAWYARRRQLPVGAIEVGVERDASEERGSARYRLTVSFRVEGPLDEVVRADLLRVAKHCPVHRLMTEVTTEIETVLLPPSLPPP
jgi:putative redox protein